MPEGDAVHRTARRLHAALSGEVLTRTDFRVPALATADLSGAVVRETVARGKHLLTRTDRGFTLHTHLRMEGAWRTYARDRNWGGPAHEIRVVLETGRTAAVGLRLPVVELLPTTDEHRVVGHLGPDVLGSDWDPVRAAANLVSDPDRAIGEALVDQRLVAGPGNIYKSESLFLRGVHPWTPAGAVDVAALVALLKRLMETNRDRGGIVTTGDPRPGEDRWVYGRAGRPCRRCGTPIARGAQGPAGRDRATYWCPSCQPYPRRI